MGAAGAKEEEDVFPARAGMILGVRPDLLFGYGIPRESGDDPPPWPPRPGTGSYSPRERG